MVKQKHCCRLQGIICLEEEFDKRSGTFECDYVSAGHGVGFVAKLSQCAVSIKPPMEDFLPI